MSVQSRIKALEKQIALRKLDTKIHVFWSKEEHDQAERNNEIGKDDVCITAIFGDELDNG